jgi:hypothetical protein
VEQGNIRMLRTDGRTIGAGRIWIFIYSWHELIPTAMPVDRVTIRYKK